MEYGALEKIDIRKFWRRWIKRPIIFGLPLPFIASWCDLQPSWKLMAWTFFCIIWSEATDIIGRDQSNNSSHREAIKPPPATILTRAEIAEMTRGSRPH